REGKEGRPERGLLAPAEMTEIEPERAETDEGQHGRRNLPAEAAPLGLHARGHRDAGDNSEQIEAEPDPARLIFEIVGGGITREPDRPPQEEGLAHLRIGEE